MKISWRSHGRHGVPYLEGSKGGLFLRLQGPAYETAVGAATSCTM